MINMTEMSFSGRIDVYHTIVKGKLTRSFEQINRGNVAAIVVPFAPGSEHWFSGWQALAGRRDTMQQIQPPADYPNPRRSSLSQRSGHPIEQIRQWLRT